MELFDSRVRKYYHARLMSGPAAVHRIEDPFAFARAGGLQSGQVVMADMPRLQDRLAGNAGKVDYVVRGGLDQLQRPQLLLEIAGTAALRCDRCLAPLDFALRLRSRVLLMTPGTIPPDDDDPETPEWIETEAGPGLDLQELVEDEIVLGMPLSVRHDRGNCVSDDEAGKENGRESPFSKLATLLKQR